MTKAEQKRLRDSLPPRCVNGKWNDFTPEQDKIYYTLEWIKYIDSCYCYGQLYALDRQFEGDPHRDYYEALTDEEMRAIMDEHLAYLREHATIRACVYTDGEGCTYNSMTYK